MNATLAWNELLRASRDRRTAVLIILSLIVTAAASLDSSLRIRDAHANREAAARTDHEVWVGQGAVNPHSAAHFSRYAFRPVPALAAFDSGISDYAGSAVWMEAHKQDVATLRRAEYLAPDIPFEWVGPAWCVQVFGSFILATFLFGAFAQERERGTLALLVSTGVRPTALGGAKMLVALVVAAAFSLVSVIAALAIAAFTIERGIEWSRVLLLGGTYALGFAVMAGLFFLISARSRSSAQAFAWCGGVWLITAIILPSSAAELGTRLFPTPSATELQEELVSRARDPFWGDEENKKTVVARFEQELVAANGGKSIEALGFNRDAIELQAHERFANAVYDEIYGDLYGTHQKQDRVASVLSLVSPLLALERLSAAICETDLISQLRFTQHAEEHRREIIEQLNRDMMHNAGDQGYAYTASPELWKQVAGFDPRPRPAASVFGDYPVEWLSLVLWALGLTFAIRLTLRRVDVS